MKNTKSLFEKRINLKDCQINGGRLVESSTMSSTATTSGNCSDVKHVESNDCGEPVRACTEYNCP